MSEFTIFAFEDGHAGVRRKLYRKLYGYSTKGTRYPGLLSKCNGLKLGAGAIIVPAKCKKDMEGIMKKLNIEYFTLTVHGDEKLLNNANSN